MTFRHHNVTKPGQDGRSIPILTDSGASTPAGLSVSPSQARVGMNVFDLVLP
jgi:hypothetical protein